MYLQIVYTNIRKELLQDGALQLFWTKMTVVNNLQLHVTKANVFITSKINENNLGTYKEMADIFYTLYFIYYIISCCYRLKMYTIVEKN